MVLLVGEQAGAGSMKDMSVAREIVSVCEWECVWSIRGGTLVLFLQ